MSPRCHRRRPLTPTNLNSFNSSTSLTLFDTLGEQHLGAIYFVKTGSNAWDSHLRIDGDNTQTTTVQPLTFDNTGQLTSGMPVNYGVFNTTTGSAPLNVD